MFKNTANNEWLADKLGKAMIAVGAPVEIWRRNQYGNIVRTAFNVNHRRRVWAKMREWGMTYSEIGAACGVAHSCIVEGVRKHYERNSVQPSAGVR